MLMTVERRDEPLNERRRRRARTFTPRPKFECWLRRHRALLDGSFVNGQTARLLPEIDAPLRNGVARKRCDGLHYILGFAEMTFAYCIIAAGALLLLAGFTAFALQRNALHSTERI
jgi:hypothetical protein